MESMVLKQLILDWQQYYVFLQGMWHGTNREESNKSAEVKNLHRSWISYCQGCLLLPQCFISNIFFTLHLILKQNFMGLNRNILFLIVILTQKGLRNRRRTEIEMDQSPHSHGLPDSTQVTSIPLRASVTD